MLAKNQFGCQLFYHNTKNHIQLHHHIYVYHSKHHIYGGYLKRQVWWTGIVIYLVMVATAFLGYVLPWGQMSFWAGAVITNLFSVVPYVEEEIVHWVWGGLVFQMPL